MSRATSLGIIGVVAGLVSLVLINGANATAPKAPKTSAATTASAAGSGGVANAGFGPRGSTATRGTVSPATTPPVGYPVTGIDVSSWQSPV
ncbi:MAG TPA: hypothetical protein VE132_18345, partial [Micromonosporaceae bacterium]|nr:hypothetical protein [Micromonosporaceae bacterium]